MDSVSGHQNDAFASRSIIQNKWTLILGSITLQHGLTSKDGV